MYLGQIWVGFTTLNNNKYQNELLDLLLTLMSDSFPIYNIPLSIHLSISISYVFVYYLSLYYYYSPFNIILCQYNMYFLQNMPILSFCQFLPVSAG